MAKTPASKRSPSVKRVRVGAAVIDSLLRGQVGIQGNRRARIVPGNFLEVDPITQAMFLREPVEHPAR